MELDTEKWLKENSVVQQQVQGELEQGEMGGPHVDALGSVQLSFGGWKDWSSTEPHQESSRWG